MPRRLQLQREPRWPGGKILASGLEGSRLETRFHCMRPVARQITHSGQTPFSWYGPRAWREGVEAQMSPSSSDRGSKLRDPSQNIPRVASKRGANIIKLN
ncbi:hypothetical protein AVEN_217139-1 [Araneus ventricosus]|uniref:Uncharacterized protein n=1 Tax=Araneus ventricosus TaxID=182803 RepID=A0A4Y2E8B1_ARAVE|nr:hypothetical protein AVEN_217139-1 [Araneus ventricosus]